MALDRRTITRFVARHRRGAAALCAGLAVLSMGLALRPPAQPTVPVAVAARALETGHRLEAGDLRTVDVAEAIAAPSIADASPGALVGRVLAAPVSAGEPVVEARLLNADGLAWAGPPGTSPLPLRFADPGAVGLLDAGQHLDVLAASGGELGQTLPQARVVATSVLVLAVVRATQDGGDGLLGGSSAPTAGDGAGRSDLVVLAATPEQALALAAAEAGDRLTFTIVAASSPPTETSSSGSPDTAPTSTPVPSGGPS